MGWYALGQVKGPELQPVELAGKRWVLWRRGVQASLLSATCPHLGADLSQLGRIVDGELRCEFHGFRFNGDGKCTATGYGTKPPGRAKLEPVPLTRHHGMWFAWIDPKGGPPAWPLPQLPSADWSALRWRTLRLKAHPQDITENSVDTGHFGYVHGYEAVQILEPLRICGPVLRTKYSFRRKVMGAIPIHMEIDLHVHGLGYSRVEAVNRETGNRIRLFVLASPVDNEVSDLHLAVSMPKKVPAIMRAAIFPILLNRYVHDVRQDELFWANKAPLAPPALAKGDGPIGRYQAWAKQFYGQPELVQAG